MSFPQGLHTKLVHLTVANPAGGSAATGTVRLSPNVPAVVIDGAPTQDAVLALDRGIRLLG